MPLELTQPPSTQTVGHHSIKLFGIFIHNVTTLEVIDQISRWLFENGRHYLTTPNVDHVVQLQNDPEFRAAYQNASLVVPDGMPLVWISRFLKMPLKERVAGSDLFPRVCQLAAESGKRVFLLGAKPGVAEMAALSLKRKCPTIQIAGCYSPPFGFEKDANENGKIVALINQSRTDILFVALGAPKQEKWISRYLPALNIKVALCVGAAFDFEAQVIKRAPEWMQKSGLEWLWRLCQDPVRLWRRYLIEDLVFLKLCLKEWIQKSRNITRITLVLFSCLMGTVHAAVLPAQPVNENFEKFSGDGTPKGWETDGNIREGVREQGNRTVSLVGTDKKPRAVLLQRIDLPESVSTLTVAILLKTVDVRAAWKGAKGAASLNLYFYDVAGDVLKKKQMQSWSGTLSWRPWSDRIRIPNGAALVELRLELEDALGEVFFDNTELLFGLPEDHDLTNFVVEGGFEYPSGLSPWFLDKGQKHRYPGYESRVRLETRLNDYGTAVAKQYLSLAWGNADKLVLEADVKLDQVEASQKDGGAKIEIHFFDAKGILFHREEIPVGTGSAFWKKISKSFALPASPKKATLFLKLENAKGTVEFDNVKLAAYKGNEPLLRPLASRNDTSSWKPFEAYGGRLQGALDASSLLDAPAGHRDYVRAGEDGHFYFEDGTRARFFGINIQAPQALPTHKEAEKYAERLSQWGFNLVRLHHLDAPWAERNLFDPKSNDTQHFSKDSLDRLDYFIAELKKRGIYVYLDLLVSRRFRDGDDVPAYQKLSKGAKMVAQYNRRIIELQKKYAQDLLTHHNKYTGNKLIDEPAIALMEIINESSLLGREKKDMAEIPPIYREELKQLWRTYIKAKGGADLETEANRYLNFEDSEVQGFYAKLQSDYFREMHSFLLTLGVKFPIAGSNFGRDGLDLQTNAELDFVDRHAYWDQPLGGYGDLVKFHNGMITKEIYPSNHPGERKRINPITRLSGLRVQNKPFVVSEWNIDWPNEFRAAGPILMAAYASFQDWDGIIQFNFEGHLATDKIQGNFDVSTKPEIYLQYAAASRIFHRQDVAPAKERVQLPLSVKALEKPWLGLVHGVERVVSTMNKGVILRPKAEESQDEILRSAQDDKAQHDSWQSDTKELLWNATQGFVTLDTAKAQAAIGAANGGPIKLSSVIFDIKNDFAAASMTSMDDKPLEMSNHLLAVTVARSENRGMAYNANRTLLRSAGGSPVLMEPVVGQVMLKRKSSSTGKVFILSTKGERIKESAVEILPGSIRFPIGEGQIYEIIFE